MKNVIVLILFISFPLFAEEPILQGQTENHESASPVSETQSSPSTPKETANTLIPLFASIQEEIQKGRWTENRPPGPVFNTCGTWDGAVKCYWAVFRMDNLTGYYREWAYALYNHLSAEGLEKELNYLKSSPDSLDPYDKAWFLLMTVEFIVWAIKEDLPVNEVTRIAPFVHTLTSELLSFVESHLDDLRKGLDRSGFPFILYALYNYVSLINTLTEGNFAQYLQTLEDSIKTHFFHRNDNSQADQSAKTQACSLMKREGIHRDYLEKKGLLLPGYEEFEERTAQEDRERIKDCETEYKAITFSGGGPGEPKDAISTFYYTNVLMLLKKTGGNEAVRYFIHHNPVSHREFALPKEVFDDSNPTPNTLLMWSRMVIISILREIYDDPEWQIAWESIENNHTKLMIPITNFESVFFTLFLSSEPAFLNRRFVIKE